MKLRDWPGRTIVWQIGGPGLWRRNTITAKTTRVFLCEGETDAISLSDRGIDEEEHVAVVALASATSIIMDLPTILAGKEVILCMDNDDAGDQAHDKLDKQ